tara:strand:- start:182 stop:1315 length:1134 start_codon:yes stop_codon:yes gene_type:complete
MHDKKEYKIVNVLILLIKKYLMNLDLSIVILTFQRQFIIRRLIPFYRNLPYKIVILDGTHNSMTDIFPSNVSYVHGPESYIERLTIITNYISTPYFCLCSDDEFRFTETLESSVNFLKNHSGYSSCSGYPVTHSCYPGIFTKKIFGFDRFYTNPIIKPCFEFSSEIYDNKIINRRIVSHFKSYSPRFYYSVLRTNNWEKLTPCLKAASEKLEVRGLIELIVEYSCLVLGEAHLIEKPMWYFSQLIGNQDSNKQVDSILSTLNPTLSEKWPLLTTNFKIEFIEALSNASPSIDFSYLDEAFTLYSKYNEEEEFKLKNKFSSNIRKKINSILNILKSDFLLILAYLFRPYFSKIFSSGNNLSRSNKIDLKKFIFNMIDK